MNRITFAALAMLAIGGLAAGCTRGPEQPSISDVLSSNSSLSTFYAGLRAADLSRQLGERGRYTVFAPANSAFETLPQGVLDDLLLPENQPAMEAILRAHVVYGIHPAADLAGRTTALTSLGGKTLVVDGTDGMSIGEVRIILPDISAGNGVIHVTDGILLP